MSAGSVKVGVIGAGNWGRNLVSTFAQLGALAAVCEANTTMHAGLAAQHPGVALYDDLDRLLQEPVPAVVIATPASTHYQVAKAALLAGKDLLVEKPLTMRMSEAEELVALAQDRGRILMVGHLLLFHPAVRWLKAYLEAGGLGRLHGLHQERLNLGRARSVENALWSLGVHDVAVLLYLMGEPPCAVTVAGQRILQPAIEDEVYLHLRFPSGPQGHLHTSWLWPERRRHLTLIGSAGMLTYDELAQQITLHRKGIDAGLQSWDQGSEVLFQGTGEPLLLEAEHFLQGVESRTRSPLIDGVQGLQVVRVLEMATAALNGDASGQEEGKGHEGSALGPDPAVP